VSRIEEVLKRASREALAASESAGSAAERRTATSGDAPSATPYWDFTDAESASGGGTATAVAPPPVMVSVAEPAVRPAATTDDRPMALPAELDVPASTPADVLITRTLRLDAIEQYRKLGAALHEAQLERGIRSILCTSALMGEGKTVTASNLALTLSESYRRRVLLIDADLRRPQIHAMFGIPNLSGLRDALASPEDAKLTIQQVTSRLSVVTAGSASSDPMSGLTSPRLRQVIEEARSKFDWVIVDTPPVLILPDARVLVSTVDAVLFVVRANSTPFRTVLRAVDVIKRERIFGTVLNSVEEAAMGTDYAGYDGYYAAVRPA
jgi:capsular exopolysaccharide synthesis family protein